MAGQPRPHRGRHQPRRLSLRGPRTRRAVAVFAGLRVDLRRVGQYPRGRDVASDVRESLRFPAPAGPVEVLVQKPCGTGVRNRLEGRRRSGRHVHRPCAAPAAGPARDRTERRAARQGRPAPGRRRLHGRGVRAANSGPMRSAWRGRCSSTSPSGHAARTSTSGASARPRPNPASRAPRPASTGVLPSGRRTTPSARSATCSRSTTGRSATSRRGLRTNS